MDNTTPQEVMAEPIEVVLQCYHCCLALGCKKKMKQEGPSRPPDNVYSGIGKQSSPLDPAMNFERSAVQLRR